MGIEPLCWGTGSAAQGVGLCYPTSAQSEMNLLALAFHTMLSGVMQMCGNMQILKIYFDHTFPQMLSSQKKLQWIDIHL
jgi:hypothetical protein